MSELLSGISRFVNRVLDSTKTKQTPKPLLKLEVPQPEVQRIPDHLDELVTSLRYMLARTDPNGRQCACTGNNEVDAMIRAQFERILNMIIDDRVHTALRNRDDRDKSAATQSDSRRGPRAS
jgi:hypothetical protein